MKEKLKNLDTPNLGDTPGLKHDISNAKGKQTINCHECNIILTFRPDEIFWNRADQTFEFADVVCPACNKPFELNAAERENAYDFFTDEYRAF